MSTLQETSSFLSNPAGGAEAIPVGIPLVQDVVTVLPMDDPDNGVLGRIGSGLFPPRVNTPATVGGIPLYYSIRQYHTTVSPYDYNNSPIWTNNPDYFFAAVTVNALTEVTVAHTLGGLPDLVTPLLQVDFLVQGIDWAITEITDAQFKIRNWDAVEDLLVQIYAWRSHSFEQPLETIMAPPTVTLAGAGVVSVPHGLSRVPDFISVFPFEAGGVQPAGLPIMDAAADDTNLYLRNVAAGDLDVKVYAQATHSIQL